MAVTEEARKTEECVVNAAPPNAAGGPRIWHPLAFAAWPVLFLYARNCNDLPLSVVVAPLALVLAVSLAVWAVARCVVRDRRRAGLLVSALALWFFSFGPVFDLFAGHVRERFLLTLWVLLLVPLAAACLRLGGRRADLRGVTSALNVAAASLVMMSLGSAAFNVWRAGPRHAAAFAAVQQLVPPGPCPPSAASSAPPAGAASGAAVAAGAMPSAGRPDIYYIILDSYAGEATLRDYFGFDNGPFLRALERQGFYVAHRSCSNYSFTFESVPSSLNMQYLNGIGRAMGARSSDLYVPQRMIQDNQVARFLTQRGYRYVAIDPPNRFDEESFTRILRRSTAVRWIREAEYADRRRSVLGAFTRIEQTAGSPGPLFCYAHIYCPHNPFVFGPNGEDIPDFYHQRLGLVTLPEVKRLYANEVRFLNHRVEKLVDTILAKSKTPPIIILQADHGSHDLTPPWPPTDDCVRQTMRILNAYYLPGGKSAGLYPTISPVNSFRYVFDRYFGTDFPLLPDTCYYSAYERPYEFQDVTARARPL